MGFRDDDEAQRERAERLERELREREAELRRKDAELERLRAAAARSAEAPGADDGAGAAEPPPSAEPVAAQSLGERAISFGERIGDVLGWLGMTIGVVGLLVGVGLPLWQLGSCLCSGAGAPAAALPELPRHVGTSWTATLASIRGAEGLTPEERAVLVPGAPCAVAAELASDGATVATTELSISCGARVLYPRTGFGPGTPGSCDVWEGAVATGEARYEHGLVCHDPGGAGRPALALATRAGTARLVAGTLEIDLAVDRVSATHAGEPLFFANRAVPAAAPVLERSGRVSAVTGPAPHIVGAPCALRVVRVSGGRYDCMVRLACDGRPLYGNDATNDGYNDCAEDEAGRPVRASDPRTSAEDTDPALELDIPGGRATVRDATSAGEPWTVSVALDAEAAPAAAAAGAAVGPAGP